MMPTSPLTSSMAARTSRNSLMKVTQQNNFQRAWAPLCLADLSLACNVTFLIFILNICFIYYYLINDLIFWEFFFS